MNAKDGHPPAGPKAIELSCGAGVNSSSRKTDPNFKYRNIVLLLIALFFLVRLLFTTDLMAGLFIDKSKTLDLAVLLRVRGSYLLMATAAYWYSYCKNWFFARVSLTVATLALTSLAMDAFNFYTLIVGPMPPVMIFAIFCRFVIIYCLFMNWLREEQVPPMPRTIFS